MSYIETVDVEIDTPDASQMSSPLGVQGRYEPRVSPKLVSLAAAGILACGSATAFDENLRNAEQMRAATTVARDLETGVGRRVSRAEALRITRNTLERAERERLALADNEAIRNAQLDG